jgi:hypothetical protein
MPHPPSPSQGFHAPEALALKLPNPDRVTADYAVLTRSQWRGPPEHLCERDLCGEPGSGFGEVVGDAIDAGAGDYEGEEGESRALGGEERAEEKDWVSVIREIPYHEDAPCEYSQYHSRF